MPYIKQGKNCVIIHQNSFSKLKNFFLTGNNPTHKWQVKGDWKAVYYLNDKVLDESQVVKALESILERTHIFSTPQNHELIMPELVRLQELKTASALTNQNYMKVVLNEANEIISHPWFKKFYSKSNQLIQLNELCKQLAP